MQIHLEKRIHTNQPMYRRTYTRVYVSYYLWRTEPRSLIGNQGRARVRHSAAESPTWVRMRKPVFEPATIRRNNGQPSLPLFPSIPGSSFSPSFPSSHTNTRSDITRDDKYTRIYRPSLRALHDFEQVNLSTILTFGLFMGDEATWNAIERIEMWRVAIWVKIPFEFTIRFPRYLAHISMKRIIAHPADHGAFVVHRYFPDKPLENSSSAASRRPLNRFEEPVAIASNNKFN